MTMSETIPQAEFGAHTRELERYQLAEDAILRLKELRGNPDNPNEEPTLSEAELRERDDAMVVIVEQMRPIMNNVYFGFKNTLDKHRVDYDELEQETLIKIYRASNNYTPGSVSAWVGVITRNTARDFCRAGTRQAASLGYREQLDEDLHAAELAVEGFEWDGDVDPRLAMNHAFPVLSEMLDEDLLASIAPGYLEVFELAFGGFNYADIADQLNIPIGTVRSRLSRAKNVLRAAIGEELDIESVLRKDYVH